jgi:hypothetical protein
LIWCREYQLNSSIYPPEKNFLLQNFRRYVMAEAHRWSIKDSGFRRFETMTSNAEH